MDKLTINKEKKEELRRLKRSERLRVWRHHGARRRLRRAEESRTTCKGMKAHRDGMDASFRGGREGGKKKICAVDWC